MKLSKRLVATVSLVVGLIAAAFALFWVFSSQAVSSFYGLKLPKRAKEILGLVSVNMDGQNLIASLLEVAQTKDGLGIISIFKLSNAEGIDPQAFLTITVMKDGQAGAELSRVAGSQMDIVMGETTVTWPAAETGNNLNPGYMVVVF